MTLGFVSQQNKGKVIDMDRFRSGKSLSPLRQMEAYWNALRRDGGIPLRSQIDPRGLEQLLQYAFILERIAPGVARFRIAGNHLTELAGMEVRGMPFTAMLTPDARDKIRPALESVFDSPAVIELQLNGESGLRQPALEARAILMPLRSDLGDVSRILGAFVSDGQVGRTPRRFDLDTCTVRPVNGKSEKLPQVAPAQPGFAEPQAAFKRTSAPHLRLVKTDS